MDSSGGSEEQARVIERLTAENETLTAKNKTLKRKLEEIGIDRNEASSSTPRKKIRHAPEPSPDQSEGFVPQNAHAVQVPSDHDRGTEIHGQNESNILRLLADPVRHANDLRNYLENLVNGLPSDKRPNMLNLDDDVHLARFENIWTENNIDNFKGMIRSSVSAFHIPFTSIPFDKFSD